MTELNEVHGTRAQAGAAHTGRATALDAAARIVGPDNVVRGNGPGLLGPNTSMFRSRRVGGVIRPTTVEQVRQVVATFNGTPGAGPLHAISTGRNWGLGSHESAQDDVVVLDLGRLASVRDIDIDDGWAVVEPGVTQGSLSQLLDGTDRMANVTVSAAQTSVVGNALDRGVGLRHQRVNDLVGLEVVLPDGELLRVGWWPDHDKATPVYPHGLGPSLLPLFVQSNLGVVTAAAIRLLPRPEALRVVRLTFEPDALGAAITALRRWVHQGLARGVPRVFDQITSRSYGGDDGKFLVHLCVDGTAEAVAALVDVITTEARATGVFSGVSHTEAIEETHPNHDTAVLVERGYAGDPDHQDRLFEVKMGQPADKVDEHVGFVFFLPLVPFNGESVTKADRLLREIREETGVRAGATLHILDPEVVDCVVAMRFDRDDASASAAHHALDLLYERFSAAGFSPYRLDIDHADWLERLRANPPATALTRRLKAVIDPAGTIAPGRYH